MERTNKCAENPENVEKLILDQGVAKGRYLSTSRNRDNEIETTPPSLDKMSDNSSFRVSMTVLETTVIPGRSQTIDLSNYCKETRMGTKDKLLTSKTILTCRLFLLSVQWCSLLLAWIMRL